MIQYPANFKNHINSNLLIKIETKQTNYDKQIINSCSGFGHFVTSGTNFRELFPGIRSKLCTLGYHFFVPIFREIALGWGMTSVKSASIKYGLTRSNAKSAPCNADGNTSNAVSDFN